MKTKITNGVKRCFAVLLFVCCMFNLAVMGDGKVYAEESLGQISSGMGAVYGNTLYYAVNGYGLHTGIMARDLSTGKETEVVSNKGTNGFNSISIYDGYLYCAWDKYIGTDDSDSKIYRFSLDNFKGTYLADGQRPVVADDILYYWTIDWDSNYEYEYGTLHFIDLNTLSKTGSTMLGRPIFGVEDGYIYRGIYDYFYLNGNIIVELSYEEMGEYDRKYGGYLWKKDAEKGVRLFDMTGNQLDSSNYQVKYVELSGDGAAYGFDYVANYSNVMNGGEMLVGVVGDTAVLNYISEDGISTTLKGWLAAE